MIVLKCHFIHLPSNLKLNVLSVIKHRKKRPHSWQPCKGKKGEAHRIKLKIYIFMRVHVEALEHLSEIHAKLCTQQPPNGNFWAKNSLFFPPIPTPVATIHVARAYYISFVCMRSVHKVVLCFYRFLHVYSVCVLAKCTTRNRKITIKLRNSWFSVAREWEMRNLMEIEAFYPIFRTLIRVHTHISTFYQVENNNIYRFA